MRAIRRTLLAVATAFAVALAFAVATSGGTARATHFPAAIQTTSYPWVQPPAGVGTRPIAAHVAPLTCSSVQPPCWITMR